MKKIYNAPEVEIVKVNMVNIIAESPCPVNQCEIDEDEYLGFCTTDDNDVPA